MDAPNAAFPVQVFRVGTLAYSRRGLAVLFAWLLWGDVCFTIMESVPGLIPLQLKALDAPNWLMALIVSTLPNILNATVCPWVSYRSDRHRGPRGRRIPFILYTAPFLAIALALIGSSDRIGPWLQAHLLTGLSPATVTILVIAVCTTLFSFFNMFVASVFWYLLNDVVPEAVMGRFVAAMRVVGSGAGALYSFCIFPLAGTHMAEIFAGASLLYLVCFTLICLRVKEGTYPPPPAGQERPDLAADIRTYFKECFAQRFYWSYFLFTACISLSLCCGMFTIFLQQHLGLTLERIGILGGIWGVWFACTLYLAGMLADRFHPLRILLIGMGLSAFVISPIGLVWLFVTPTPDAYFAISVGVTLLSAPLLALGAIAGMPAEMRLFPTSRYGQFCSANALVRSVAALIGGLGAGLFMDVMKAHCGGDAAYRYIPAWQTLFQIAGFLLLLRLYRAWRRLGGAEGTFIPPEQAPAPAAPGG